MKRNFLNQHRALEVLLGRYMRTVGDGRATLDGFVSYVRHNRDIKTQLATGVFPDENSCQTGRYRGARRKLLDFLCYFRLKLLGQRLPIK